MVRAGALTTMVIVVVVPHSLGSEGVKVYVVVAVLFNAGVHVPSTPFKEVVGNGNNVSPAHIGATCVKVGVTGVTQSG